MAVRKVNKHRINTRMTRPVHASSDVVVVLQRLLAAPMSAHTPSERELQGSSTVLVQPGYDGGGSQGEVGDVEGPKHPMVLEVEEEERGPLRSRLEFLLLCLSLAIGTRTVVQYPVLAMRHGGGAFTFVYLVLTAVLGSSLGVHGDGSGAVCTRRAYISVGYNTSLQRSGLLHAVGQRAAAPVLQHLHGLGPLLLLPSLSTTLPWHLSPTGQYNLILLSPSCFSPSLPFFFCPFSPPPSFGATFQIVVYQLKPGALRSH
ncbi:uncharacterized protein LOC112559343 isoform X2 [Pomacea canaliculata]|uniref:uncharacterized protein LOC112559343 isoform X2 n=1 Tax=Pomacea canaliculata TaxID=400727 RepID=UPI000D73480B|nr:uncharacterized protein LOC112559343 isoform X2 [Pomacea canaliculata]